VLETRLQREQVQIEEAKSQRAAALQILNSDIASQDKNLKSLKKNQAALQSLMSRLERQAREADRLERERRAKEAAANNRPAPSTKDKPVWSQEPDYSVPYRGNCSLPASGGIRAQFGADRGGGLRWNGIVIAANSGADVKVVKKGKVLYADFLRGYGKLVIVDHGGGFMSLYGYNQSINVKTGDSVSAKQTVASVGDGSEGETGLYFETRLRGRPSQPGNWCNY
jgi:septal ring factor EnvC (AmiA/AmiB activator)